MNRALRNCNPLNIRRVASTRWKGQAALQTDRKFVQFQSMEWGIRAACCILRTYARRYNAVCVRDIVHRWAPPAENATEQYVSNVCRWTGFGGYQRLTERDWPQLLHAMARQECGLDIDYATIAGGLCLYKFYNLKELKSTQKP